MALFAVNKKYSQSTFRFMVEVAAVVVNPGYRAPVRALGVNLTTVLCQHADADGVVVGHPLAAGGRVAEVHALLRGIHVVEVAHVCPDAAI